MDALDVHTEAQLLNIGDQDILLIMLGKQSNGFKCAEDVHNMLNTVATFVNSFRQLYADHVCLKLYILCNYVISICLYVLFQKRQ